MVTLPPSVRLFVATTPVDGRKGFDALSLYVQSQLQLDALSGLICPQSLYQLIRESRLSHTTGRIPLGIPS